MYGGQQFERALAEFRAVVTHADLGNVSFDEIASSAGLNRLNNVPNFGWAASDLASAKTRDAFVPLIDQLTARVVYIVKRLATLADTLVEAERASHRAATTPTVSHAHTHTYTHLESQTIFQLNYEGVWCGGCGRGVVKQPRRWRR